MLEEVLEDRLVSGDTQLVLGTLVAELTQAGCTASVKKRGYFGKVIRFHQNGVFLFDALPARNWVKFYFSSHALRYAAFRWERIKTFLPEAEQRAKDQIVSIRLGDPKAASAFCAFLISGLGSFPDR